MACDERFDRLSPNAVARSREVEEIWHDGWGKGTVVVDEFLANIQVVDEFAVVHPADGLVDLQDLSSAVVEGVPSWEDSQKQQFCLGEFATELLHNCPDAIDHLGGCVSIVCGVVGADHNDGHFGVNAVKVAIIHSPEDMLGAVPAGAEIEGFAMTIVNFPDPLAAPFPTLGDGVADEGEVDVALICLNLRVEALVPFHPVTTSGGWVNG